MKFGDFIKGKRLELGISLREFCQRHGEDASNWSKLERGLMQPPSSVVRLEQIGTYLRFEPESTEMMDLKDMASITRGEFPQSVLENEELMSKLPLVFRTANGAPSEKVLLELAKIIKDANSPDEQIQ
jgi:transcriptional regulator with XRE-family HTH domain